MEDIRGKDERRLEVVYYRMRNDFGRHIQRHKAYFKEIFNYKLMLLFSFKINKRSCARKCRVTWTAISLRILR